MTPKEKAQELIDKFYKKQCEILEKDGITPFNPVEDEIAKQCALIAVNELIINGYDVEVGLNSKGFWNQVKTEINNI